MNNNIVTNLTIFLIANVVFFAGCVEKETTISIETPTVTMSPTSIPEQTTSPILITTITSNITLNKTDIEYIKKDSIAATIRGIDLEIVKHQKWIEMRKKGEVDDKDLPEIEGDSIG